MEFHSIGESSTLSYCSKTCPTDVLIVIASLRLVLNTVPINLVAGSVQITAKMLRDAATARQNCLSCGASVVKSTLSL